MSRHNSPTDFVMNVDTGAAAVKMTVASSGAALTYFTLNEWVAMATLGYVLLQIGLLVPKYVELIKAILAGKSIKIDRE